jgi:hypothetical protein
MRYLNKIVFINSASVKYAEIGLDGNVHLIGTQGVGKSTLLRAILFFYNANKSKLGIPTQKKRFDDYYFEYENSYIIYEVVKDNIPFSILAYKINGKVAFRFFNSAFKKELFISPNGKAHSWEEIRNGFSKDIYYTKTISSYEEYRKILYGDNKGLKPEFRKYALIESKQYQNIPRTIQNVLLNSNLEAKFIKDTIINSISEDEFKIDISNYAKNHLRDFETQINDIKIWFNKNKKGQITIRNQAEIVIVNYRIFNFLKREKKELTIKLSSRINFIKEEKPSFLTKFSNEESKLNQLVNKKENLKKLHLTREQKIISKIDYLKEKLKEANDKLKAYEIKNINLIIEKIAKKEDLISEKESKIEEKQLLTSKFSEISHKYEALIKQVENQLKEFINNKNAEINKLKSKFGDKKLTIYDTYKELINKIQIANQKEKEIAENELSTLVDNENAVKRKKAELKHQLFYEEEIKKCEILKTQLETKISNAELLISKSKNETDTIRKEWELENKEIERNSEVEINKAKIKNESYQKEVSEITNNLKQSKSSLYGWLNDNIPNWENSIGKVIDEKNVLFNSNLNPKKTDENKTSFFGLELNLNAINKQVKTVEEFEREIKELENKIQDTSELIKSLSEKKENRLNNLKTKFRKKISTLKDIISENEYIISQSKGKLKDNIIAYEEWKDRANKEKERISIEIENKLEELSSKKEKAKNKLEQIKKTIQRKINKKEREREDEIVKLERLKDTSISEIQSIILEYKEESKKRLQEIKQQQNTELSNKGADTKRLEKIEKRLVEIKQGLEYIKNNERTVIEYEKDKRELFDKIPEFKTNKTTLEKKLESLKHEQEKEQSKLNQKLNLQRDLRQNIKETIEEFNNDEEEFEEFKKSETYSSVQVYFLEEIQETESNLSAIALIKELNDKHYSSINKFKDLQQSINTFIGNFNENNIFSFKVKLNEDSDYLNFATELKEFIEEDKIAEYEKRVNERFAHIIHQIGNETTELVSKEAEIEKIIKKINNDFTAKNFVQAIKEMEMRTQKSSNPIVKLLVQIKEFNDENNMIIGEQNLFTSSDTNNTNNKAVNLLKQLVKELEKYKNSYLTLSESFDLQFRIVENDNDSGWVEKLANVGSEGTDVLVKAMINILLLNVFKNSASRKFKDFKLHCMMDEIGRLHPNNVKGILRFANERNILLINGSPTSQNATDYKYTYKLSKQQSKTDNKKYITKITRLVKVNSKVLN